MSDQSPPPKPKPGSLRDRIAAFEKSSASAAPAPPPPRPKPGGVSWKPKPPSPPSSPKSNPDGEKKASGMSASDAKESIGKGVSLKERMAALQGKGGFGAPAPAPPTAPKPAVERPKWKPPPVVSPPAEEGSDPIVSEPAATADVAIEASKSPPVVSEDALTPPAPPADEDEKDQEAADPDEEERQRRAAITARIARLGGARVGMGPPIFGRPAVPAKKPSLPHEESAEQKEAKEAKDEEITAKAPSGITDEPVQEHAIDPSKESSSVSEEESSSERLQPPEAVPPPRAPNSMPVPAVPRRAAPPRRKAKSPAPPLEETSFIPSTTEDEPPAAISDDVTPAAAPTLVLEEPADNREEHLPKPPSLPPVDTHVELVTAETGPAADLPKAKPGTDDQEEGTPAVAHMDEATSSIADGDSHETIPYADAPDAISACVETQLEESPAPAPASEEPNSPNSPEEPSVSSAKESSQPEVKAESPLQQPNLEVHEEERAEGRTVDARDKDTSPQAVTQRASVDTIDDTPPPTVDLTATSAPSDAVASPAATPLREEENLDSVVESTEEEEEAARRARVAARLAKMGAVNPFAPPPQRRLSHDVASPPPTSGSTKPTNESVVEPSPVPRSPIAVERDTEMNTQKDISPELSEPSSPALDTSKTQKGTEDDVPSNVTEDAKYPIDAPSRSLPDEHKASLESISKPVIDAVENEVISHFTDAHPSTESASLLDVVSPPSQMSHPSEETAHPSHPPHPRRSLPPPRRVLPQSPDDVRDAARVVASLDDPAIPPPPSGLVEDPKRPDRLPPRTMTDDEEEVEEVDLYHRFEGVHEIYPHSNSPNSGIQQPPRPETDGSHFRRSIPPIQTPHMQLTHDEPQTPSQASQPDEDALPTVLRFHPSSQDGDDEQSRPESRGSPIEGLQYDEAEVISPVPPPRLYHATHTTSDLPPIGMTSPNREILDEEEGDPIDPSFHSPVSPKSSRPNLRAENETSEIEPSADEDQARRRTIAERMAKLGGIKLGGAPPLTRRPLLTQKAASDVPEEEEPTSAEPLQEEDEEDEQARRQRILARLAGSGGMRLGMIPPSIPHHSTQVTRTEAEEEPAIPAPPPRRAAPNPDIDSTPPPPPPPHRVPHSARSIPVAPVDTDSDSQTFSDAVQVEAEDSELEEVRHEDADIPPPIPVRIGRHPSVESTSTMREQPSRKASLPPAPPTGRPPVPKVNLAMRRASTDHSHQTHQTAVSQGDYVLVSDSMSDHEEVAPPPPPMHTVKHFAPPPAPPDLGNSQWELPSIPAASIDFGEREPDLSLSNWSEDSATFATSPPPTSAPHPEFVPVVGHQHLADDHPRSSEELMMVWGRVGVQICEVATMLFEKSKKTLIGDGSYPGFIHAVLAEVPNAASPRGPLDFGSLIYMQTANAVQKRLAEIMPGDIILLDDVKLKGHKGLQIYHQNVGTDEPLIAVVNDFEAKKSKVKVFQANQHVGQQTVESASYRLEDVKSGVVKVFRVLEA